jgi:hypothetical protein
MGVPVLASGLAVGLAWHGLAFAFQTEATALAMQLGILALGYLAFVAVLGGFDRLRELVALFRRVGRQSAIA